MRLLAPVCLSLVLSAAACASSQSEEPPVEAGPEDPAAGDGSVSAAPTSSAEGLSVGDWAGYADPVDDPPDPEPLDDARWARVTADLACAGREKRGDPGAHRLAARRVLQHHRTTAEAVERFATEVNAEPERARALGERVAQVIAGCR